MLSAVSSAAAYNWADQSFASRTEARGRADAAPDEVKNAEQKSAANSGNQTAKTDASPADKTQLSEAEQREVEMLKQTDREVRQHEMQHIAVGGSLVTGGANFSYKKGPDGQSYAVGGEVSIDTSKGRTPEETLSRAIRIRAAALAPADPSPQDRRVAAMAGQMEMQAMREIAQAKMEESEEKQDGNATPSQESNRANSVNATTAYQAASGFGQAATGQRVSLFV
ncbi:MAG: hypothetical protein FWG81_03630 [Betaproteobacteria bacterium]|nr:hypothetical protein [Betaproteobacteria bacterium]